MKQKFTLLLCLAALMLTAATGCNLFRKSKKPKENPAIAGQMEADFKQRWMDQRIAELTASGSEPTLARQQAELEFREQYPYLLGNRK